MVEKRKKPPSRERYERNNPLISIRLTKSLKEALQNIKGDKSYPQIIKETLQSRVEIEKLKEESYKRGYEDGYGKAKEEYLITFPCVKCGESVVMLKGSPRHKQFVKALNQRFLRVKKCDAFMHEECK